MASTLEDKLRDALRDQSSVAIPIGELGPAGVLATLADGGSYHVHIQSALATVEIEVGNGIVTGARSHVYGETIEGREAYALLRGVRRGVATITPRRFLSMANVFEPIAERRVNEASDRPIGEARRLSIEIDVEPEWPEDTTEPEPIHVAAPIARETERPQSGRGRWMIGAGILFAISGITSIALALVVTRPAPEEPPAIAISTGPHVASFTPIEPEPAPVAEPEVDPAPIAREARRLLRAGRERAALVRARRAARLRPGSPAYQVLLGDALEANGDHGRAERAWRRALRIRPGHRAATQRLRSTI
jgi:hypothetical protein